MILRPLLWQTACVLTGLAVLAAVSALLGGAPSAQPPALVASFAGLYLATAGLTRRRAPPATAWRASALPLAAACLVAGAALQLVPVLVTDPQALLRAGFPSLAPAALALAVCSVLWEELWFRGPVLNLVAPGRPQLAFALVNGALFAALHLLNPKFDVVAQGPELVLAGVLLTLAYFASGSFWVPLALHLGNNLAGLTLGNDAAETAAASWWRAGLLLVCGMALSIRILRRGGPTPPIVWSRSGIRT